MARNMNPVSNIELKPSDFIPPQKRLPESGRPIMVLLTEEVVAKGHFNSRIQYAVFTPDGWVNIARSISAGTYKSTIYGSFDNTDLVGWLPWPVLIED